MNTVGWWIKKPEEDFFLALHGDVALLAKTSFEDKVWQFRTPDGARAAIARLVELTDGLERDGGRLQGDLVEFDLSLAALCEIRDYPEVMEWPTAPLLRVQLMHKIRGSLLTRSLLVDDIARIYAVPK